jgi:hypothetical protein
MLLHCGGVSSAVLTVAEPLYPVLQQVDFRIHAELFLLEPENVLGIDPASLDVLGVTELPDAREEVLAFLLKLLDRGLAFLDRFRK